MDEGRLKRLIRMVEESDIDELEVERPFGRVRITRRNAPAAPVQAASAPATVATVTAPVAEEVDAPPEANPDAGLLRIVAPMVGTYYEAPAPGAKAYVAPGDMVSVGQVVCIVEAMKLMNEIQSEVSGRVERICVENGQPVEFGQEIFLVSPA
ncbi:MAG: acetyl-CoA carboxylase biotin carboxyl carrier protein [Gemmatimonadota bacterium]|nr:acetyl-CoA carboxylase biotin carboxyl carrier protein [Gemmatimonadota bacterium]MDP6530177.1 acetyl-CoA carboxylase biotin carboxyl carrier protein [Gemmatimonadota bacterium]MDP6802070.1 acetyl-CoA carboxylase biotin carboxyl carrier protein [Gemmatimonadota bacterium]MDP7032450.1 acetyl-CoA carboxylase biotin carboxyl carrier protein [Gemmatimonadota bacterium]